jgi:hypothetical protein
LASVTRLCERPGCSEPAAALYGIDQANLVVWLDRYGGPQSNRAGVLCARHADAMVVPLGWMLDDRRDPTPKLFRTPVATAAPKRRAVRGTRRAPDDDTEQLRLDAALVAAVDLDADRAASGAPGREAVVALAETGGAGADETGSDDAGTTLGGADEPLDTERPAEPVVPWQPLFDQRDDLRGLLRTRGRLLSRAFHGTPLAGDASEHADS